MEHDLRALTAELRRRNFAAVARAVVPRRNRVHAVFARNDPLPSRASADKLRRRLRRRTI